MNKEDTRILKGAIYDQIILYQKELIMINRDVAYFENTEEACNYGILQGRRIEINKAIEFLTALKEYYF